MISLGVKVFKEFVPRYTQWIALWSFISNADSAKGRLGEVATGEGKSIIVAMLAVYLNLMGQNVDILTSSSVLSVRDSIEMKSFF